MKLAPPKYLETLFIYALFTLTSTCLHIKKKSLQIPQSTHYYIFLRCMKNEQVFMNIVSLNKKNWPLLSLRLGKLVCVSIITL